MIEDQFNALLTFLLVESYTVQTSLRCINYSPLSCIDIPLGLEKEEIEGKGQGVLENPKNDVKKLDFPGNVSF